MTQRRRGRRARRGRFGRRAFLAGAGCAALAGAAVLLGRGQTASASSVPPTDEAEPNAALPTGEWRAVWVSYLEWAGMDFSSEEAFRAGAAELMDNCLSIGLNTVIAQVRPFGDALYRSTLFPWSHLCTGVQGQDPGLTRWTSSSPKHTAGASRWKRGSTPTASAPRRRCRPRWRKITLPMYIPSGSAPWARGCT